MRSRPYNRAKTHLLKADNLQSILEPADPRDATFTATKGKHSTPGIKSYLFQTYVASLRDRLAVLLSSTRGLR